MPERDQLYDPAVQGTVGRSENVGGPRHTHEIAALAERDARAPWRCVACGEQNTGRALGEGCEHCHAGEGAARFKGVDPVVPKPRQALQGGTPGRLLNEVTGLARLIQTDVPTAFLMWIQTAGTDVGPLAAFRAGWLAREGVTSPVTRTDEYGEHTPVVDGGDVVGGDLPDDPRAGQPAQGVDLDTGNSGRAPEPDALVEGTGGFVGTAQDRTLLAALAFLREQVYSQQPEEVATGEWLKPEQLDEWIRTLKGPYA